MNYYYLKEIIYIFTNLYVCECMSVDEYKRIKHEKKIKICTWIKKH